MGSVSLRCGTFTLFGLLILLLGFSGYLFCKYRNLLLMLTLLQANMKSANAVSNVLNAFNDNCEEVRREMRLAFLQGSSVDAQSLRDKLSICESGIVSTSDELFSTVLSTVSLTDNSILDEFFAKLAEIGTINFLVILILVLVAGLFIYSMHWLVSKFKCNGSKLKTTYCLVFRSSSDSCVIDVLTVKAYYGSLAVFAQDGNVSNVSLRGKFFPKLFFSWTGFKVEDRDSGKTFSLKTFYKLSLCEARC